MKKYNLILTKDNAHMVAKRIAAMIERKGVVYDQTIYTGKQHVARYIKDTVTKSRPSAIKKRDYKIEVDNDPDMQLIRINWDKNKYPGYDYGSGAAIKYGTKMYITSEKIVYKEMCIIDGSGCKIIIK